MSFKSATISVIGCRQSHRRHPFGVMCDEVLTHISLKHRPFLRARSENSTISPLATETDDGIVSLINYYLIIHCLHNEPEMGFVWDDWYLSSNNGICRSDSASTHELISNQNKWICARMCLHVCKWEEVIKIHKVLWKRRIFYIFDSKTKSSNG